MKSATQSAAADARAEQLAVEQDPPNRYEYPQQAKKKAERLRQKVEKPH